MGGADLPGAAGHRAAAGGRTGFQGGRRAVGAAAGGSGGAGWEVCQQEVVQW
jgi:hypothetical protein